MEEMLNIPIKCGYLSYAETPKEKYYQRILGVTGTLRSLHEQMKKTLGDYKINFQTFTPSIFGDSRLTFNVGTNEYVSVEMSRADWNMKIMGLVKAKFENKQAVLIFFESNKAIEKF